MTSLLDRFSNEFFLVGGTAIALQVGHRESIDFDLFSSQTNEINREGIERILLTYGSSYEVIIDSSVHYEILIGSVKITRYAYPYELHAGSEKVSKVLMPSLLQLGAIKLHAIQRRAKRKDYVDIFILSSKLGIEPIMQAAISMFGGGFSSKLLASQLVYTDDIDFSEQVVRKDGRFATKEEILTALSIVSESILKSNI